MTRDQKIAVIDNTLTIIVVGSAMTAGLLIPNLLIGLDKPLEVFGKTMNRRARERELRKVLHYMKSQKLIEGSYEHGLKITAKGRHRLATVEFRAISLEKPKNWDKKWRLVLFDIPEDYKAARNLLSWKLKSLGFTQLQKSVWLHPFPCRDVVEQIAVYYKIESFVTYIETSYIDNQERLIARFRTLLPKA